MRELERVAVVIALAVVAGCSKPAGPCGDGELHGQAPPKGTVTWCARSDGTKHGTFTEWHANGVVKTRGEYANGKMEGVWATFWENTVKHTEGNYRDGRKDGTWRQWDDDGTLQREEVHRVDSAESTWTGFRPTGEKWATGVSVGGRDQGPYQEWYSNGKLAAQGNYEAGKRVGTWMYWNEDGTPSDTPRGEFEAKPKTSPL